MTNKNKDPRPTSPHLQIYAWNISSLTSIMHRLTGIALYFSIVAISWYVVLFTYKINDAAEVPLEQCDCAWMAFFQYAICAFSTFVIFAVYYHFCNGIRHLFWDIGKGFDIANAKRSGYAVILSALVLTAVTAGLIAYFKFL